MGLAPPVPEYGDGLLIVQFDSSQRLFVTTRIVPLAVIKEDEHPSWAAKVWGTTAAVHHETLIFCYSGIV